MAATSAFAQSSVQIDGIFDAGYYSIDYKGNKVTGMAVANGSSTSQINFRGTQDLGGGLKANFRLESDFNPGSQKHNQGAGTQAGTLATGSTWGNGEARVGLDGGFGRVDLGVVNHETLTSFLAGQPFGTAVGSTFRRIGRADTVNAINASQVRTENAIKYITPSINGFKGSLYKASKVSVNNSNSFSTTYGTFDVPGVTEFSLQYNKGPINAVYSSHKTDNVNVHGAQTAAFSSTTSATPITYTTTAAGTTKATLNTLGANYTMGAVTVYALNQTSKTDAATPAYDVKLTMLSAAYQMGVHRFMVGTGTASDSGSSNNATGNGKGLDTKITSLGYDYALSKTVALYARHENINDKGSVVPAIGASGANTFTTAETRNGNRTTTAIGLRVNF